VSQSLLALPDNFTINLKMCVVPVTWLQTVKLELAVTQTMLFVLLARKISFSLVANVKQFPLVPVPNFTTERRMFVWIVPFLLDVLLDLACTMVLHHPMESPEHLGNTSELLLEVFHFPLKVSANMVPNSCMHRQRFLPKTTSGPIVESTMLGARIPTTLESDQSLDSMIASGISILDFSKHSSTSLLELREQQQQWISV